MLKVIKQNINLQNDKYAEKIEGIQEKLKLVKEKLYILTQINMGDKIGKNDNGYFIIQKGVFQKILRLYHFEDRRKTFKYLNDDFINFFKFCNDVKTYCKISTLSDINAFKKELNDFINLLMNGLYNLKLTYKNEVNEDGKKLICKIDSIIFTLIDFKNEMNEIGNLTTLPQDIIKKISGEIETMLSVSI